MEAYDVYKNISERTGGDIYVGVVGPVRTGKSTFIKQFMDLFVLPNIDDQNSKERVIDELPQSGSGRMIMTTQPKFIPNEAVSITVDQTAKLKVRMVDCVGYLVEGATGHMQNGEPRMVRTPWYDYDIPFEQAAEIGTRKVIEDHSTIGIVLTTDGTITDIPRSHYVPAEERVISELKGLGKPFVIILNSATPNTESTSNLCLAMQEKYMSPVIAINIMTMSKDDINDILRTVLFEFPIKQMNINISKWVCALSNDHWLLSDILGKVSAGLNNVSRVRDYSVLAGAISNTEYVEKIDLGEILLGEGVVNVDVKLNDALFYKVLGEECGYEIKDDCHLVSIVKDLVVAKKEYSRLEGALRDVNTTGYGIVPPMTEEVTLEEPELFEQAKSYGVRLKASAPSLHMTYDKRMQI